MLIALNKYIVKSSAAVLIIVTFLHLISLRGQIISSDKQTQDNKESVLVASPDMRVFPSKVENNMKGFDRSSESENSLLKILGLEKIIYSDDVAKKFQNKIIIYIKNYQ
ncbi:MAG: hypothetical protein MZV64_52360 [Ignavibacteriales bacterium]|nr:hypothetical protein [Ignavibacteriales bacterium]